MVTNNDKGLHNSEEEITMQYESSYPRISQIIPVDGMYQEHSQYDGTGMYIKIFALVLFEDLVDGKISQYSKYLSHQELCHIEDNIKYFPNLYDDTWIANVLDEDISDVARANSNLAPKNDD